MSTPQQEHEERVRAASFALAAAEHAALVTERAEAQVAGAREHRDGLEARHAAELAAADDQITEAEAALERARAEQAKREADADAVPAEIAELTAYAPRPVTIAAAETAGATGGVS